MGQGNLLFIKSEYVDEFAKLSDSYLTKLDMYKNGIIKVKAFPYSLCFKLLNY